MVFVISSDGTPLDPCHEARARELLKKGRAAVWRMFPLTIKLKDRTRAESVVTTHRVKLDPGSKTTGIAVVQEVTGRVVFAAELTHRGQAIRDALLARRGIRRSRRRRKTRYRPARFANRRRPEGWLAPSLLHRVLTADTWVRRLRRFCPVTALSVELAKFDTQLMQNPEISGVEYQRGELLGWEVRAYLLEKWGRRCAYCGTARLQPGQGQPHRRRVRPPQSPGQGSRTPQGRGGGERDPPCALPAASHDWPAYRGRKWRAHALQSGTAEPFQSALSRRRLRGGLRTRQSAHGSHIRATDRRQRARIAANVPDE